MPAEDEVKWILHDKTTNFSKANKEVTEIIVHILGK